VSPYPDQSASERAQRELELRWRWLNELLAERRSAGKCALLALEAEQPTILCGIASLPNTPGCIPLNCARQPYPSNLP
jgi:hypothetical protein